MPKFSLIIPVYNVESYLAECLDSCINQTFKDIEIICINDCSPDKSDLILSKYAKKDSRVKIINHEKNKGLGGARNTGISAAAGKYTWFIDSDDYIILNACEILNDIITQFNADIIRFNRIDYEYDINTKKKTILPTQHNSWETNKLFTKSDFTKLKRPEVSACVYITLTDLLKTVKFREGIIYEDNDFTPILFSKSNTIYNSNYSLYCVRQRAGSISRDNNSYIEKRINHILPAINALYEYNVSEKLHKLHFCTRTLVALYSDIYKEYVKHPELHTDELNKIIKKIKNYCISNSRYLKFHDNFKYLFHNLIISKIIKKLFFRSKKTD